MNIALRLYFRRIYLSNDYLIPKDKPIILASNHPNAFMDALLLGALLKRELHFLVRSDVFNTPFKKWILKKMHQIPIYRVQEGAENLGKNEKTFKVCYDILKKNGAILIFSEGLSVMEKRLRPLKKGTARIALGAAHMHMNLYIVPVGINYTYSNKPRSEVMIDIGQPVAIGDYYPLYNINPANGIKALNKVIEKEMSERLVIITHKENEEFSEQLLIISRNEIRDKTSWRWLIKENFRLKKEQEIVMITAAIIKKTGRAGKIYSMIGNYFQTVQKIKINDELVKNHPNNPNRMAAVLMLAALFPLWLAGYILCFIPAITAKIITRRKVKELEFYSSVLLAICYILFIIYTLICTLVFSLIMGPVGFFIPALMLPLGYAALVYRDKYLKAKSLFAYSKICKYEPDKMQLLSLTRKEITETISQECEAANFTSSLF